MRFVALACCLLVLVSCTSNKTENKSDRNATETQPAAEGFLGTPWGADLTAVQATWLMRPESEMGDVTVYLTGITSYKTIPIQSATAAFRKNKLIGMGFEVADSKAVSHLIDEFNTTYSSDKKPTSESSTGSPATPDSIGAQTTYRWETPQSTVVLIRVYGRTSYVFMMKKGESLPQMG